MSRGFGIWGVGSSLLDGLDLCKRPAGKYWTLLGEIVLSTTPGHLHHPVEGRQSRKVGHPGQIYFCGRRIECKELPKLLNVGDRVRMFCDDGAFVAEKISQTQFQLIHAQELSELVH